MCPTGNSRSILKKYVAEWKISTEHFDPSYGRHQFNLDRRTPLEDILVEGSSYSRGALKRRLYEAGLKKRECELCGQTEMWRGRRMSLILDHINGVNNDHRLENLQIVCPNCAATLSTHCGRNKPRERTCRYCGEAFEPRTRTQSHCSVDCGRRGLGGVARPARRKVERPSLEQLRADLESMSLCAVGRKYGVSDNAVRKWLRFYEREASLAVADAEAA